MKKFLLIILSPIIFTCCTSREEKIIQQAEKVMFESPDSANQMLLQIVPSNLNNERIKAYYALIKSAIDYKLYKKQSIKNISQALSFYKQHGNDSRHLQMAYFYAGAINEDNGGDDIESLQKYKEAELFITNKEYDIISYQTLSHICKLYQINGYKNLSITYAKKVQSLALSSKDSTFITESYNLLGLSYLQNEQFDSSRISLQRAMSYSKHAPFDHKVSTLQNWCYLNIKAHQPQEVYSSIYNATNTIDNDTKNLLLSTFFDETKQHDSIIKYAKIIAKSSDTDLQYYGYNLLYEQAQRKKDAQSVFYFSAKIDSLNPKINNEKEQEKEAFLNTENSINKKMVANQDKKTKTKFYSITTALFFLLIIPIIGLLIKIKKKGASFSKKELALKNEKLCLNETIASKDKQIKELGKKCKSLLGQQIKDKADAEKMHDCIINIYKMLHDKSLKIYDNKSRELLLYSFRIIDKTFCDDIDRFNATAKDKITKQEFIICILAYMNFNKEQILQTLSSSDATFRKHKSRLLHKINDNSYLKYICDILSKL